MAKNIDNSNMKLSWKPALINSKSINKYKQLCWNDKNKNNNNSISNNNNNLKTDHNRNLLGTMINNNYDNNNNHYRDTKQSWKPENNNRK